MEIRVLKYFLTVAREEYITKAAEALHITQPTLSRQLNQLEDEVGVKLFERGARKVNLTNEGLLLRRRAEEIISLVDKTEAELAEQGEHIDGSISIGSGVLSSTRLLADIIKGFSEIHPLVKFDIYTAGADLVREKMNRGLIDIGLLLEPVEIEKFDFLRLDVKEKWVVLMPENLAPVNKKFITGEDLKKLPLIMPSRESVKNELLNRLKIKEDELNIVCKSDLADSTLYMVKNGLGCLVTLDGALPFLDTRQLIKIPLCPKLYLTSVLAWKRHQPFSLAAARFIDYIKEYFGRQ
ncbi:MAG: LysR family transcriptional regulator [Clostridiales bacterium]|nr:LysR family transcriptional regulator [Clostridiales bacterium]